MGIRSPTVACAQFLGVTFLTLVLERLLVLGDKYTPIRILIMTLQKGAYTLFEFN